MLVAFVWCSGGTLRDAFVTVVLSFEKDKILSKITNSSRHRSLLHLNYNFSLAGSVS